MDLRLFKQDDLFKASISFFRDSIGLQLQTKSKMPISLESQFETFGIKSKRVDEVWSHVDKTYYIGLLDDDNFGKEISEQESSELEEDLKDVEKSEDEYPGILIFAVNLNDNFNPTRSNLTEINRTLNRFSQRVPALVLARYGNKISLMLADRVAYKQEWREGEKVRKVSLLRDIDLDNPHAGHLRILTDLVVPTSGTNKVENFDGLYEYWKEVLDTSELNKKFYQDLSNWYFWAIKHVRFPDEPTIEDSHEQNKELDDMLQEHRATNVIRLLTRLLFVWFIKEKGLIPVELFDLKSLQKDILKKVTPHHEHGMFKEANKESIYYKAILQNLFFATLNCPIEASSTDNRERGFRSTTRGVHFGVTYLMRYEQFFKNRDAFLGLVNSKVPFLNGGLFECLDERGAKEDKRERKWVDGFSDNLPNEHKLIVPDFLFFGVEEEVDLSVEYGLKSKKYKEAAVKGLLNIFKSYKFTITENTPIEEDVALDPELLGKVFENLLASYNPETKTTARKQTGSFYTPREIVNYMVDESLIAYLKNSTEEWDLDEENLDDMLYQLLAYEETVPFKDDKSHQRKIITALSNCTILDPACGSGAFPMGILQKMVHILQKLDPDNEVWKDVQKEKASKEADRAISEIEDKEERGQRLQEINEAFDERMNAPDYARKLFLIENCIYGVDIQPVATQISKLRFFISLVVEQKVGEDKRNNFGIRPLPNLETKFVTANTLIDIESIGSQGSLSYTKEVEKLHNELRQVRSKLFSARTTETKHKYRQRDEELRQAISKELKNSGMPAESADKLANWDPYDQNASSPFFNPEWMFDVEGGFDVVIANPPYVGHKGGAKKLFRKLKRTSLGKRFNNERMDLFYYFFHVAIDITNDSGTIAFITTNYYPTADSAIKLRRDIIERTSPFLFVDFNEMTLFESAKGQHNLLTFLSKDISNEDCKIININSESEKFEKELPYLLSGEHEDSDLNTLKIEELYDEESTYFLVKGITGETIRINTVLDLIQESASRTLGECFDISQGVVTGIDKISPKHGRAVSKYKDRKGEGVFIVDESFVDNLSEKEKSLIKPWFKNSDINKFTVNESTDKFLIHTHSDINLEDYPELHDHLSNYKDVITLRNYDSGELSRARKMGSWWALSSSRRDYDFDSPKIVSPQRSYENTFGFTRKPWCASADVYFISQDKNYISLLALLSILNSKLYYHWLYNRGKRKGDMLELYLTPLQAIPLPEIDDKSNLILELVSKLQIYIRSKEDAASKFLNEVTDSITLELFFKSHFAKKNIGVIDIIKKDLNKIFNNREFENLSDLEKGKVIKMLHELWSNPNNEVRKRINSFPEKSPDILKPILEG